MAVSGHIVFSTAMYIIGESFYSTTPGYHASSCGFESVVLVYTRVKAS